MLIAIAAAALSMAGCQDQPTVLGTYQLAGRKIEAVLPVWSPAPPPRPTAVIEGVPFVRDAVAGPQKASLMDWDAIPPLLEQAKAAENPVEWQTKLVVFTRSDILDKGADGVYRQRRTSYSGPEAESILAEAALFAELVKGHSGGKVKLVIDAELETEPIRFNSPEQTPWDEKFARDYFGARLNGGGYVPEDNSFNGPYHSVMYVHTGLAYMPVRTVVNGNPVTGFPGLRAQEYARPGQLARHMFNAWVQDVGFAARRHGYQLPENYPQPLPEPAHSLHPVPLTDPLLVAGAEMWPELVKLSTANYPANYPFQADAPPKSWDQAAGSPWTSLLRLTLQEFQAGQLPAGTNSNSWMVLATAAQPAGLVFVPVNYAPLVQQSMGSTAGAQGFQWIGDRVFIVFVGPTDRLPALPWTDVGVQQPAVELTFDPGQAEALPRAGHYFAETVTDETNGSVLQATERGFGRNGWLRLIGRDDYGAAFDAQELPFLELNFKPMSPEPLTLLVTTEGGGEGRINLLEPFRAPAEGIEESRAIGFLVEGEQKWQKVVVDLREVLPQGQSKVTGVYLASSPRGAYWERREPKYASYRFDDVRVVATPSSPVTAKPNYPGPSPDPASLDPEERALFLAQVTPESTPEQKTAADNLLGDPDHMVQINAAAAFLDIREPLAEPRLIEMAQGINPFVSDMAVRALAFQNTDAAWAAIRRTVEIGPFHHNRIVAAELLATKGDPLTAGVLSQLFASQSWQARLAGASAIAALPGDKAPIILMTFLLERDPYLRLNVIRRAKLEHDLVAQRLMWYSVNDPSDAVRTACYLALLGSPKDNHQKEGVKGTTDDSRLVQIAVLEAIKGNTSAAARTAVLQAVVDGDPEVRAKALELLAEFPSPVENQEIANVMEDTDPRVQLALIALAQKKSLQLPPRAKEALRKSVDPVVVQKAQSLGQ